MEVELLHATPLDIVAKAIRKCYNSQHLSDDMGDKDRNLINKVGNLNKHESVKNHVHLSFEADGISTKTLLALSRHQIGIDLSVQSTRYTLSKEFNKGNLPTYIQSKNARVNVALDKIGDIINGLLELDEKIDDDDLAMLLPQSFGYNIIVTFSMQALQHFLYLRLDSDHAHYDIVKFAELLYLAVPDDYKYLFEEQLQRASEEFKKEYTI